MGCLVRHPLLFKEPLKQQAKDILHFKKNN